MKRNRKLAIVSKICLASVVFAVACVCLYPVGVSTSGGSGRILTEHRDQLDQLTQALVDKETLDDKDIREMFGFPPQQHVTDLV